MFRNSLLRKVLTAVQKCRKKHKLILHETLQHLKFSFLWYIYLGSWWKTVSTCVAKIKIKPKVQWSKNKHIIKRYMTRTQKSVYYKFFSTFTRIVEDTTQLWHVFRSVWTKIIWWIIFVSYAANYSSSLKCPHPFSVSSDFSGSTCDVTF
jgi:hypothetical protein